MTFGPTTAKTQNVAITITNDADYENDETIELQIVAADHPADDPGDYYARDAGATATVTIIASDDAATTIIDGGGGAKGYEPTNVQVVPGDRTLTVSWTVTSRPDVDDDEIWHAVRWSQTHGRWDNPGSAPDRYVDGHGLPINGIALEPGVTSYKITGLKNRVVTGVHVRSFSSGNDPAQRVQAAEKSSHWVRLKGNSTTPAGDEVTFDKGDYAVAEGGTVSLGLSRYDATATSLDVPLTVTLATADGAASSSDYTGFSSRSVVIPANSAAATSSVVTTSDDLVEEDETLTVSMSVPEGSVFRLGDHSTTTITVEDDDRANARIAFGSGAASTTKYTATVSESGDRRYSECAHHGEPPARSVYRLRGAGTLRRHRRGGQRLQHRRQERDLRAYGFDQDQERRHRRHQRQQLRGRRDHRAAHRRGRCRRGRSGRPLCAGRRRLHGNHNPEQR